MFRVRSHFRESKDLDPSLRTRRLVPCKRHRDVGHNLHLRRNRDALTHLADADLHRLSVQSLESDRKLARTFLFTAEDAVKIRPFFAWYDLWIGFFWDQKKQTFYILPIPCFGIRIEF
jgi:hypothetical protein